MASTADIVIYGGCVSGDTEYLSPTGWRRIDEYDGGEVAQWFSGDSFIKFTKPTEHQNYPTKELIHFKNENRVSMVLSDKHRMPLYDWDGRFVVKLAKDIARKPSRHDVPVNFFVVNKGLPFSDYMLRLIVAIHADGNLTFRTKRPGAYCRISLRKQRKIKRLLLFLKTLHIEYHEYRNPNRPTEVRYGFQSPVLTKHFTGEYWGANSNQLKTILEEISYWDGAYSGATGGDICYNSSSKEDADFIQYAAHACGRVASISHVVRKSESHKDMYRVHITREGSVKSKVTLRGDSVEIKRVPAKRMYCFSVPSSFWLARHDGRIFVTGNSAGSGKTWALLLMPLYHRNVEGFNGIVFRRVFSEITQPGGLWDKAQELYNKIGAKLRGKPEYTVNFTPSSKIVFRHLEHESDMYSHQGGEYCYIGFDELTSFTSPQFFYLISRNRSTCGVRPFVRATCNPECDSWVKALIQWWLDEDTGLPIDDRCGVIRYFTRGDKGEVKWVDRDWRHPDSPEIGPTSITFIGAKLEDNPALLRKDPAYKSKLLSQSKIDRMRLLDGNWNAKPEDGMFMPDWFQVKDELPQATSRRLRVWDRANTEKDVDNKNPDFTAGVMGYMSGNILCIDDLQHFRASPAQNEERIKTTAEVDGRDVEVVFEQEPASSGKDVLYHYKEHVLKDFVVRPFRPTGKRTEMAKPLSSMAERRAIWLKKASWNREFINELSSFPPISKSGHDDIVVATVQLLTELTQEYRVVAAYSSKNLTDRKYVPDGVDYCVLFQEKDLRVYACFMRWDFANRILYVYDEAALQNATVFQLENLIKDKGRLATMVHCNDYMNREGDSLVRLLSQRHINITESPRFNDEGAVAVVNQMFLANQIFVSVKCVETDKQLRSWMIENGKPGDQRIGCAKCICMVVSDLRDQRKIEPPAPPRPYSAEKRVQSLPPSAPASIHSTAPVRGYGKKNLAHWMY